MSNIARFPTNSALKVFSEELDWQLLKIPKEDRPIARKEALDNFKKHIDDKELFPEFVISSKSTLSDDTLSQIQLAFNNEQKLKIQLIIKIIRIKVELLLSKRS